VLNIGGRNAYIAGDTENTPEMSELKGIDIAFLPMNQPYTMTPEQLAKAVRDFKPKIVYPYHYGDTDLSGLPELLKDEKQTELRIRPMK
jgi:L-ascorbate metabolism protein UlaG (beta-lactamase superfamily)